MVQLGNGRYLKTVLLAAAIAALCTLVILLGFTRSASEMLLITFGGGLINRNGTMLGITMGIFPAFIASFFFADYLARDFSNACVYIFTRSKSRLGWVLKKIAWLFLYTGLYWLIDILFGFLALAITHKPLPAALLPEAIMLLLFNTLAAFMLLLPVNLLAVRFGTVKAFVPCFGVYAMLVIAGVYAPPSVSRWLPFSQGFYAWHDPLWFARPPKFVQCTVRGLSPAFSLIYMAAAILIEIGVAVAYMQRIELLDSKEGEI
jgi:hypothetical protein